MEIIPSFNGHSLYDYYYDIIIRCVLNRPKHIEVLVSACLNLDQFTAQADSIREVLIIELSQIEKISVLD